MATSDQYLSINAKRLVSWQGFKDHFLDFLRNVDHDTAAAAWKNSGTLQAIGLAADGNDKFKLTGYPTGDEVAAIDGNGNFLKPKKRESDVLAVNFENNNLDTYDVAIKMAEIPNGINVNPRDGMPEWDTFEEIIGWADEPDNVTDNGNGTITFEVDGITEATVTNAGRSVKVWKVVPAKGATTVAIALETCTVAWTGGKNKITTVDDFGQITISTTAADYKVCLVGPRVSEGTSLVSLSPWCFIGEITGNGPAAPPATFDTSAQNVMSIPLSDLTHITRYENVPPNRLKIEVDALSGESGVDQIRINHIGTGITFKADEAGNITTDGSITVGGIALLKSTQPEFWLREIDGGADAKVWRLQVTTSRMYLQLGDDAESSFNDWLRFNRTGNTPTALGIVSDLHTYGFGFDCGGVAPSSRWNLVQAEGLRAFGASPGGYAASTTFTSDSSGVGAGTGTVKMNSANPADSTGWIKIYVDTAIKWIPFWDTNAP